MNFAKCFLCGQQLNLHPNPGKRREDITQELQINLTILQIEIQDWDINGINILKKLKILSKGRFKIVTHWKKLMFENA